MAQFQVHSHAKNMVCNSAKINTHLMQITLKFNTHKTISIIPPLICFWLI